MDLTVLFQELIKQGPTVVLMGVIIYSLKKDLDKERDKNSNLTEKTIEQVYLIKEQADSFLETLDSLKEMFKGRGA